MADQATKPNNEQFNPPYAMADLPAFFPLNSSTSGNDKLFLLGVMGLARKSGTYGYVEIGSYLGGSLTPFLLDPVCEKVLSIDDRGRVQGDERGINFDYTEITTQTMLDGLKSQNVDIEKLETFDGSVNALTGDHNASFNVGFIDGEHTNEATFRDFLWMFPLMKPDAIILFHDSPLIFKAIKLTMLYLDKLGIPYTFFKRANSEMSALFFGNMREVDHARYLGPSEDAAEFFAGAEADQIKYQFRNRAHIRFAPGKLLKLKLPLALDIIRPRTEKVV